MNTFDSLVEDALEQAENTKKLFSAIRAAVLAGDKDTVFVLSKCLVGLEEFIAADILVMDGKKRIGDGEGFRRGSSRRGPRGIRAPAA
jgi:hypothetical protein